MAETLSLVCDYCGKAAVETVKFRVGKQNYLLDVCRKHLDEIKSKARKPRRGRPRTAA
jgi:hypothetical protein